MKRFRSKFLLFFMMTLLLFITGCTSQKKISDAQLVNYFAESISSYSKVVDGYAKYLKTNQDYVTDTAKEQTASLNSIQDKLKKSDTSDPKIKNLLAYTTDIKKEISDFKNDDFKDYNSVNTNATRNGKKFEKSMGIKTGSNKTISAAVKKGNRSWARLQEAYKELPGVDGKAFKNSAGKITFNSIKPVPADNNNKVVEVDYTYENTANEPMAAEQVLTFSGKFTQETEDSVDTLYSGVPASDWEMANRSLMDLESDSTLNKLKPGMKKQYVTFLKVDNDSPITFKAKDPETNESIGKIKLSINQ